MWVKNIRHQGKNSSLFTDGFFTYKVTNLTKWQKTLVSCLILASVAQIWVQNFFSVNFTSTRCQTLLQTIIVCDVLYLYHCISLTTLYRLHAPHRHLDFSWAIAAESSLIQIVSSRTRTGNCWFSSQSR